MDSDAYRALPGLIRAEQRRRTTQRPSKARRWGWRKALRRRLEKLRRLRGLK